MISAMQTEPDYGEPEFRIELGHIFSHLNRAWRRRLFVGSLDEKTWLLRNTL